MSRRILLVEDDEDLRLLLSICLRRAGHDVVAVETGEEALERLTTEEAVDLVLLDIRLPGIDGFQVLESLPRPLPSTVIAMSAHAHQELADRAVSLGCASYLTKPFTAREMVAAVEQHLVAA